MPTNVSNEVLTVTGSTITIPDTTFTPQADQFYELTQTGAFTVPAHDSYTFDSLTLLNVGDGPTGDLNLGTSSVLNLNTATIGGSLNLADGATFTNAAYVTVSRIVTLTGAPTLNINGTLSVNNTAGATDAFTATGAATINLGSAGATGLTPTLYIPNGNFNGGAATINGYAGSDIELDNGNFTTTGSVTADRFIVAGNVSIGGTLQAGYVSAASFADDTITVGRTERGYSHHQRARVRQRERDSLQSHNRGQSVRLPAGRHRRLELRGHLQRRLADDHRPVRVQPRRGRGQRQRGGFLCRQLRLRWRGADADGR